MNLRDRIEAGIFGHCVADALGVPVEFLRRNVLDANPVSNMREYGTYRQPRGTWSDDSSMTFCLMESLVNGYAPEEIALKFWQWKNESYWTPHGAVFDIGLATRAAINEFGKGTPAILSGGMDEFSNGNGSLMRILPMAFYLFEEPDVNVRYEKVKAVSSITHGHIRSVIACFFYVEFLIDLLEGQDKVVAFKNTQTSVRMHLENLEVNEKEFNVFRRILNGDISIESRDKISSSGYVLHSIEASFWAFLSTDNYADAVLKAVNLGEDTDTIGAITGGLAGVYYGLGDQINFWRMQLARFEDIEDLIARFSNKLIETKAS